MRESSAGQEPEAGWYRRFTWFQQISF